MKNFIFKRQSAVPDSPVQAHPPARNTTIPAFQRVEKIRVENLHAWFGSTEALKGVTLTVLERQVTAIIGPSGCGKSTFIRCLNRMHEVVPDTKVRGSIIVDGQDI